MLQQELDVLLKFVRLSSPLTTLPEYIEDEQEYQSASYPLAGEGSEASEDRTN